MTRRFDGWQGGILACGILLWVAITGQAATNDNIALGRLYTFSVPPNYPLCTDQGDATDLTDGRAASPVTPPNAPSLWGTKGAVGWMRPSQLPAITVDLGSVQPILGAALHTASGTSSVAALRSVPILVSDDGQQFYYAGDLVDLNSEPLPPDYPASSVYWLKTHNLVTRGRYVQFVLIAGSVFGFVDEIEVYRGNGALPAQAAHGEVMTLDQLKDPRRLTLIGARARVRRDLQTVAEMIQRIKPGPQRSELQAQIEAIHNRIPQMMLPGLEDNALDFRAIVPFSSLHAQVYALYGRMLANMGLPPLTIWHSEPQVLLGSFEKPRKSIDRLEVQMMGNERRSQTFNVTNASASPREISFSIEFQREAGGVNPPFIKIYQVEPVDTAEGRVVSSALMPIEAQDGVYHTYISAGMTRQIWLAFESYENALPPGKHEGVIHITADENKGSSPFTKQISLRVTVAPLTLTHNDRFTFMIWDYIFDRAYGITEQNQAACRQQILDDPLVNGVWTAASTLPWPKRNAFDEQGNLVGEIDFARWDAFVRFWPGMKHYFVFAGWWLPDSPPSGLVIGTPRFERAMAQWAKAWAEHNRSLGLKPGQAVVLFIDEPAGSDVLRSSAQCANAFKAGTNEILTFTDPNIASPNDEEGRRNIAAYDIVCPHLPSWITASAPVRSAFETVRDPGSELWFYSCSGPNRLFDLSYFRLQPWYAFQHSGTGGGFWAYSPHRMPDSWNEFACPWTTNYALLYVGPEGVTASKQWEAAHEGVQDYYYLDMLRQRIADLRSRGRGESGRVRAAEKSLNDAVASVVNGAIDRGGPGYFNNPAAGLSMLADDARLRVLKALLSLESEPQ